MALILTLIVLAILVGVPVAVISLLARTKELQRRVATLEHSVQVLRRDADRPAAPALQERNAAEALPPVAAPVVPADAAPAASASRGPEVPQAAVPPARRPRRSPREPDWFDRLPETIWRWFTEGNVPVKVGMVVLFAGVGALLKYAADQGWMSFPIEMRLAGIALAALAGLAFGWHQRAQRRTFALSLQGGAIGVLLMTSFAAYKLYGLLDPLPAFISWVVLAGAAGALAVRQDTRVLAVLGILAGFMAPVLMSTSGGNHVALFSFHAVLNAAIFCVAWYRSWRELNLLGFACTFGIATVWGVLQYQPEQLSSTLPFLVLFFVFYALIPIIHARRDSGVDGDLAEASLVFGTPLVSFSLLAGLLDADQSRLAWCALGLAGFYALLAWQVTAARAPLLRRAHWVLAGGFATLAVPLALSAQATASVFALEGAALVWFGLAQSRTLTRWAGAALQCIAALCLVNAFDAGRPATALANAGFTGALLLALAGFASAWSHARAGRAGDATGFYLWGLLWWLVMGWREIALFTPDQLQPDALLGFAALSAAAAALAPHATLGGERGWTVAAALAAALPLAFGQVDVHVHPFAGRGFAAWIGYGGLGALALWRLRAFQHRSVGWAHAAWLLALPLATMLWLHQAGEAAGLDSGWLDAALILPWLVTGAALLLRPGFIAWPLANRFDAWRQPVITAWMAILAGIGALLLLASGDASPLPWVPLLNPVELSLVAVVVLLAIRLHGGAAWLFAGRVLPLSITALLVITSATLRAVHQLGGVRWELAMFDTALAQASLSLVWSVLGVAGWVAGSRRRHRGLWQLGAVLMGIVLVKLVLVDRIHLGNLPGIASFIGYGLLCTLVGYLAPAPPRRTAAA